MVVDDQLFFSLIFPFKSPFIGYFSIFSHEVSMISVYSLYFPILDFRRFGFSAMAGRIHGFVGGALGPSESWEQTMVSQATHMGVSISGGL